jgi:hypothetical protein
MDHTCKQHFPLGDIILGKLGYIGGPTVQWLQSIKTFVIWPNVVAPFAEIIRDIQMRDFEKLKWAKIPKKNFFIKNANFFVAFLRKKLK